MTNPTSIMFVQEEGRRRPFSLRWVAVAVVGIALLTLPTRVSAHAEPERANPPINGTVTVAPAIVEIWFDEEVSPDGSTVQVIGPGGIQVDLGDAAVDLFDPNRQHVTVSLLPNLEPGAYTVQWRSVSSTDGDAAQGGYLFTIGSGTPVASPAAATAVAQTPTTAAVSPAQTTATPAPAPPAEKADFDGQGFGIAIGVGLVVAGVIFAFWRMVRPKKPANLE